MLRKEQLADVGEHLGRLLACNQISNAINFAQQLLAHTPGIAESLLEATSPITRSRLNCLFLDILAGYPQAIYAAPVCLQVVENTSEDACLLPEAISQVDPSGLLRFHGWMPVLKLQPYSDDLVSKTLGIPSYGLCTVLAIFKTQPEFAPESSLKISPSFWAALFKKMPYCVHVSTGPVLSFPVAQSIANAMADSISSKPTSSYPFADEALLNDARRTAISFREASAFSN